MTAAGMIRSEKIAVPVREDFYQGNRKLNKLQIFAGVALTILNISLVCVTCFMFFRVQSLENDIEILINSVNDMKMKDESLINAISRLENDSLYGDGDYDEQPQTDPEEFFSEDLSDRNDYDYFEETFLLNSTENPVVEDSNDNVETLKSFRIATNLTKDGVETSRIKRNVIAATQDGVVINSESYAERKALNTTRNRYHHLQGYSVTPVSARPSSFGSPPVDSAQDYSSEDTTSSYRTSSRNAKSNRKTSAPVYRRSRVMHQENRSKTFRQVVKRPYLKAGDTYSDETTSPDFTVVRDNHFRRRYRPRHQSLENLDENPVRMGRVKLPAIHYSGDTSKYVVGQHTNFNGNGHLRHPQRTFVDWKVSDWAKNVGMDSYFTLNEGILTVKDSGLYFIYAQIYYLDEHDTTGYRVYRNREAILQCTITVHSRSRSYIGNTCYTAGVQYLSEGDTISLTDVTDDRYSLFEPGKSFFGLIKISDIKIS